MGHKRVSLEPSYLIHQRPYRDTSVIADFITQHHGRVSGVVRGVRTKTSKKRTLLQSFCPLVISWSGRGDLVNVNTIESSGSGLILLGNRLICGLYLNELVQRLVPAWQGYQAVFGEYITAIGALAQSDNKIEPALRQFERRLLSYLGYGIDLKREALTGEAIVENGYYRVSPGEGLVRCHEGGGDIFLGACLAAIAADDYHDQAVCRQAKLLMRMMITPLLAGRPLVSRELLSKDGQAKPIIK